MTRLYHALTNPRTSLARVVLLSVLLVTAAHADKALDALGALLLGAVGAPLVEAVAKARRPRRRRSESVAAWPACHPVDLTAAQ